MRAKTPLLQQYFRIKAEHPGVLLAMRVGDFYEFYGEDAEVAARALEIVLTAREDGGSRIPMAGVPYHAVERYLARLVAAGHRVALCDQLEDPKQAKGLVRRGVTRILTPGTLMEDSMLSSERNNFLAAVCARDGRIGLAFLDTSTGEFAVTEIEGDQAEERLQQELARLRPAELLAAPTVGDWLEGVRQALGVAVTETGPPSPAQAERKLLDQFQVSNLHGFGVEGRQQAVVAAAMVLSYAEAMKLPLAHVESLSTYSIEGFMRLDLATRRSLELTQNLSDGSRRHTLLSVLDHTVTAMGARLMRRWIEQPLLDLQAIRRRLEAVEQMATQAISRGDLRDGLKRLADMERLVSRAATGLAGPRDLAALRNSLAALPALAAPLRKLGLGRVEELREQIADHTDLLMLLDRALVPDPPHLLRDGGVIREGYDLELDKLRDLARNGRRYIAELEQQERARTGIASLKVGFNAVFGYYLEVSRANLDKVPPEYVRKQTTANAERFITAELKEHESQVLGAEDKAAALEADLFQRLRARVAEQAGPLLQTARALAEVDVLAALAEAAAMHGYTRPEVVEEDVLEVEGGRHPVVEASSLNFVPNDTSLGPPGGERPRLMILTGPNMSGKSTYLRQNALIVLMAQVGSFVPARSARIGLCDRIFARIGAKDELALGQSTFMVEMVESANILNHASERSLVILDEVGRGTSTFDGLAIAWAMVEYLAELGAKTLFATHYHQLNQLEGQIQGVANFRVAVEEVGEEVVWTHRVLPGGTDRSYGIHVARMAGVPQPVLRRAAEVLAELERKSEPVRAVEPKVRRLQLSLFELEPSPLEEELRRLDLDRLTPIEALKKLDDLKRRLSERR
ncbi:MAG: DNA mismatch repair protein MutS [Fimbriimonadales bacterium]|nr:DNA mismatch repair protein MutS [Fimbriimonadales bacterium]